MILHTLSGQDRIQVRGLYGHGHAATQVRRKFGTPQIWSAAAMLPLWTIGS
jgi:hypothetical protein